MESYEQQVIRELKAWEAKIMRPPSLFNRYAKRLQKKVNASIPEKVHEIVTSAVKNMVKAVMFGSEYTTKAHPLVKHMTLKQRETLVREKLNKYKKIAAAEGAGTGAGGIMLGFADFPLLLGIKMKFLFDTASLYGFNVKDFHERLYILHLFQLAFSSDEKRKEVYRQIANWEQTVQKLPSKEAMQQAMDWRAFQLEYRDTIDLPKMLQMIPGVGAVVGAYVNYHFLDRLGETAMNGYRMRFLFADRK